MIDARQSLLRCLDEARQLIFEIADSVDSGNPRLLEPSKEPSSRISPLERLENILTSTGEGSREPIRIIQHFSCSGGSLFAKCIAAMPNTILLSEIHPLSTQLFLGNQMPKFCPTDVISLARIGKVPTIDQMCEKVFRAEIQAVLEHLQSHGKRLVLREHTHSSYLLDSKPVNPRSVEKILGPGTHCLSVVTVRHPVDSFLSLRHLGWIHFRPKTFKEYCKRYLSFLKVNESHPVFRYEDLVDNPGAVTQEICDVFEIPFNKEFEDYLDLIKVTGDSGRSSSKIGKRNRRPANASFLSSLKKNKCYIQLCDVLGYSADLEN